MSEPKHLISIDDLDKDDIQDLFKRAQAYLDYPQTKRNILKDKIVANLFFEASTRTRLSFEIAAKRLGAHVVNLNATNSSIKKGETFEDTLLTIGAMKVDFCIVREKDDYAAKNSTKYLSNTSTHVINAGSGRESHPSQGLTDAFTLHQAGKSFEGLSIAIVGDIFHSRVTRSLIRILKKLGTTDIRAIGPDAFLPAELKDWGIEHISTKMEESIKNVDVIYLLRIQKERIAEDVDVEKYQKNYCLNQAMLSHAKSDVMICHPGPINRNVEIAADVAYNENSFILQQVTNGVAMRMAIMEMLAT